MRLNKTCRGLKYAAGIGFWCFALTGSVQAAQTSMYMTGTFPNGALGPYYVGPYQAIIGGSGPSVPVICDDFVDDTWIGESWTANVIDSANLSSNLGLTKFGTQLGSQAIQTYEEAAWLGLQLMNAPSTCGGASACAGDYQYAIWQLMDPNPPLPIDTSGLSVTDQNFATSILNSVTGNPASHLYNNFTLYSYVPGTSACPGPCGSPQEFMVVHTPEPSQAALLGLDFSGLGALLLVYRRYRKKA
jgi:hypothetical protein